MNMKRKTFVRTSIVSIALSLFLLGWGASKAQAQLGSPPPTYDYDNVTPSTQPPASTLLGGPVHNYETRFLRTHQLNIPIVVPLVELQQLLPAGFVAIATPSGSDTALVTLGFHYQVRWEKIGDTTFGPFSALVIFPPLVLNTNLGRTEQVSLVHEVSDPDTVDFLNDTFGPGGHRLAKVKVEIKEKKEMLRFKFDVQDDDLGLDVRATAEGSATIVTRLKSDPFPPPLRWLNGSNPNPPNPPWRAALQADLNVVPTTSENVEVVAPHNKLHLPGGDLTILGVGSPMVFLRGTEAFTKLE